MTNTDRARKLLIRSALVTSTTIATLIGAQNLAVLDARNFQVDTSLSSKSNEVGVVIPSDMPTPVQIEQVAPSVTIQHAAPSVIILRQSGQLSTSKPSVANVTSIQPPVPSQIQPPVPSQINPPAPVVVQQPVQQRSRSSR
ncbi:MAG: hypothetical protein CUN55_07805 [Phototrophicales bacterium]|nr:MAG: hypothetical protein CUN55_07805 [Phototrophicales bacterium]